ncbi:pentatricopeptide repeat-containing protein, chloroplastic [Artemisia annua]|uniref:Pentatricopeptide repeat-containing protein, chloroplastic n=1 Tax=Artemisia annua TaxID=35608 RepID=A0A2U1PVD8_ARTAN|nr:pentatricopeptide repeat-containing protein, chloroplastic [Artemisia annua]
MAVKSPMCLAFWSFRVFFFLTQLSEKLQKKKNAVAEAKSQAFKEILDLDWQGAAQVVKFLLLRCLSKASIRISTAFRLRVKACCSKEYARIGEAVFGFVIKAGYVRTNVCVGCALIDLFTKGFGDLESAKKMFDQMPERNFNINVCTLR